MLTISNLTKSYGNSIVLNKINLTFEKNSIIGLAGPSGGGKSTLLRCIQGLDTIDEGNIVSNGDSGFMFQDFQLFPHMTVLENLIYAPSLQDKNTNHVIKANKILDNLNIKDKTDYYPSDLSGGQKQRVALARSLMMNPDILLCDEPTSGLDIATIDDVVDLLKSVQQLGVTMLIASHDLDFLGKIADRIIVLNNGQIALDIITNTLDHPTDTLKKYY